MTSEGEIVGTLQYMPPDQLQGKDVDARCNGRHRPALPMRVAVRFESETAAEAAAKKPGVRRTDAYTVQCEVKRQCDVIKWLTGIGVGSEIVN